MKTIKEMKAKLQAKKQDNKGFSLVELIIVIAIMAILVGIIASQVIPYMEKSRESKDLTTLDTCLTSFQTTLADKEVKVSQTDTWAVDGIAGLDAKGAGCTQGVKDLVGMDDTKLKGKFKSSKADKATNIPGGTTTQNVVFGVSQGALYVMKGDLYVDTQNGAVKN